MAAVFEAGNPTTLTESGSVRSTPGALLGFYVNSTTAGTIVLKDGGSSGTDMSGTITPAIGWHRFPASFGTDLFAKMGGTINVTFFTVPA